MAVFLEGVEVEIEKGFVTGCFRLRQEQGEGGMVRGV